MVELARSDLMPAPSVASRTPAAIQHLPIHADFTLGLREVCLNIREASMPTSAIDSLNWGPMRFRAVPAAAYRLTRAARLQPLGIVAGFRMGFAGVPRPMQEQSPELPPSKDAK